jgi:hypothetical protein
MNEETHPNRAARSVVDYAVPRAPVLPFQRHSKLAVAALVFSIASCPFLLIKLLPETWVFAMTPPLTVAVPLAGLAFGVVATLRIRASDGMLTGLVPAVVGTVLSVFWLFMMIVVYAMSNSVGIGPAD